MNKKKSSWEYQKNIYKQVNIKFNMNDPVDSEIYDFLSSGCVNVTQFIKCLLNAEIKKMGNSCYKCMGASFGDCDICEVRNEKI